MNKTPSKSTQLLFQYLSDHLAASVGGIALARRCLNNNSQGRLGSFLRNFISEIEGEHRLLRDFLLREGHSPSLFKIGAFWLAEKIGRLKLNQSLVTYSDLSRLFELEGLLAGVRAKVDMWKILESITEDPDLDPGRLALQGQKQLERIQDFCLEAGARAFRFSAAEPKKKTKAARIKPSLKPVGN